LPGKQVGDAFVSSTGFGRQIPREGRSLLAHVALVVSVEEA